MLVGGRLFAGTDSDTRLASGPGLSEDQDRVLALMITDQARGFPGMTRFIEASEDAGRSWVRLNLAADALAIDGPSRTPLL